MRTIKFRAWDKKDKRMLADVGILTPASQAEWIDGVGISVFRGSEKFDIMQFTGLCDKNGKEIYEGDIVKCEGFHTEIYIVKYGRASFVLGVRQGLYDLAIVMQDSYQMEVIGNIYENDYLLDNQQNI